MRIPEAPLTRRLRSTLMWGKFAAAIAVLSIVAAAPAGAEPADDTFIGALDAQVIPYTSRDAAIAAGKSACDGFGQGDSFDAVTVGVREAGSQLTSLDQAVAFVKAAAGAYCPQDANPNAAQAVTPESWGMDDGIDVGPRAAGTACLAAESHQWADSTDGSGKALWCPPPAFVWVHVS